jgi:hypothetical protein
MTHADFIANIAVAVLGSGLGTTIVGALFKSRFDHQLELQKAVLERASRVHERQVETLINLDRHLREALGYMQLMSKSGIFEGEDTSQYPQKFREAIIRAHEELTGGRLLLPPRVVGEFDAFFKKMSEGQLELAFFSSSMVPDGSERAKYWDRARKIAYDEAPRLLRSLEDSARALIHGSS